MKLSKDMKASEGVNPEYVPSNGMAEAFKLLVLTQQVHSSLQENAVQLGVTEQRSRQAPKV
jgi:hypothetical protein